jgi:hypothetical protein
MARAAHRSPSMIQEIAQTIDSYLYSPVGLFLQLISAAVILILSFLLVKLHLEVGDVGRWVREWRVRQGMGAAAPVQKGPLLRQWNQAQERIATNDEAQWKLAVIEADAILDTVISDMGFSGETMGERMRAIEPGQLPYLDDAWRAHKVRNYIAHNADYKLPQRTAEIAFDIYRRIFTALNIFP